MVFNLPSGLIFHDNWKAFNKWHDENTIVDFLIAIFGVIVALIFPFYPDLTIFIKNHLLIIAVLFFVFIFLVVYNFFKWKMYNFKKTDISIDSTLIINHNDELLTINVADNIIIPSEDVLSLNLTLNFDEDIIKDLEKNEKYEIIFDKPTNLDIEYQENEHKTAKVIGKVNYSKEYKIQFDYRHNTGDTHAFKLESDLDTTGRLKIYFRTIPNVNITKNGFFKDAPLFNKKISTTAIKYSDS